MEIRERENLLFAYPYTDRKLWINGIDTIYIITKLAQYLHYIITRANIIIIFGTF